MATSRFPAHACAQKYPEKKKEAQMILARYDFPPPPEFQLVPLPDSNPILEGVRWKQYHFAMGSTLKNQPDIRYSFLGSL